MSDAPTDTINCNCRTVESRLAPGESYVAHSGTCPNNSALHECERCGQRHADLSFAEMLTCTMEISPEDGQAMADRVFARALGEDEQ